MADCFQNKYREKCRIELLGPLRVAHGDDLVTQFPRQKAARLLTFLALTPGQAHPRERLIDLFWPDDDLPAGRASLSTTLSALRRLLPIPNVLLATHQAVRLNPDAAVTDAAEFERLMEASKRQAPAQQVQTLTAAAALHRGDACAGMYDDWALRESERLRVSYADALRGLTLAWELLGDLEEARRAAVRWVAADLYCEDAHLRLIALHLRAGQGGEARTAAKKLESLWREEFGAALSPAVRSEIAAALAEDTARAAPAFLPVLPLPLDPFFGRERELAWLSEWLVQGEFRLVTLVGPGGMGKTRLALDFAARSAGRTASHFVSLVEIEDTAHILPAIARALALPPNPDFLPQLVSYFQSHPHPLLILDNLEQLVAADDTAAQTIQSLLLAAPRLSCLCTSRLALSLRGERVLPLEPLPLPPENAVAPDLHAYASVKLYVDRARAVRPDFNLTPENAPAVAAVCRLLDGSPLALELAASWVRLLPPRAMWERLNRQSGITALETRRTDAPARHHSLRAALDWSWRLLKPAEQRLLQQVSVFRGGWTLSAAEVVCHEPKALALLSALLDASLVRVTEEKEGATRYGLLETVRQYAQEQLEGSEEWEDTHRAHAAYFVEMVAQSKLTGTNQTLWYSLIDASYANINAAMDWLGQNPDGAEAGLILAGRLQPFWQVRGVLKEGRARLEAALAHPNAQGDTAAYAYALHGVANLAGRQGDLATAAARHRESLALRRALGDKIGIASSLMGLGIVATTAGDLDAAQGFYEETLELYRSLDAAAGLSDVLNDLGNLAVYRGQPAAARPLYEESLAIRRRRNDDQSVANTLSNLGPLLVVLEDFDGAASALSECLHLCLALGDKRDAVFALKGLADLAAAQKRFDHAVCLISAEAALREALGMPRLRLRECQYQDQLTVLREHLSETNFRQSWASGQEFAWPEAVVYALQGTFLQ